VNKNSEKKSWFASTDTECLSCSEKPDRVHLRAKAMNFSPLSAPTELRDSDSTRHGMKRQARPDKLAGCAGLGLPGDNKRSHVEHQRQLERDPPSIVALNIYCHPLSFDCVGHSLHIQQSSLCPAMLSKNAESYRFRCVPITYFVQPAALK
jgi:hypothetical protein